jgi:hypothetical protein
VTDLRASDADRERTVVALREHAAAGRLTVDELDERCEQAYAAKTLRELTRLQADLPSIVVVHHPPVPHRGPILPGRWGFTVRWHSPAGPRSRRPG